MQSLAAEDMRYSVLRIRTNKQTNKQTTTTTTITHTKKGKENKNIKHTQKAHPTLFRAIKEAIVQLRRDE